MARPAASSHRLRDRAYLKNTARKPGARGAGGEIRKAQGLWRSSKSEDPVFTDTLSLDMTTVEPSMAGPMRPQDRVPLTGISGNFAEHLIKTWKKEDTPTSAPSWKAARPPSVMAMW
jgi:aconitate hydratase